MYHSRYEVRRSYRGCYHSCEVTNGFWYFEIIFTRYLSLLIAERTAVPAVLSNKNI